MRISYYAGGSADLSLGAEGGGGPNIQKANFYSSCSEECFCSKAVLLVSMGDSSPFFCRNVLNVTRKIIFAPAQGGDSGASL